VLNGSTRDELRLYLGYDVHAGIACAACIAHTYAPALKAAHGNKAPAVLAGNPLARFPSAAGALGTLMSAFRPDPGFPLGAAHSAE